MGAAGDSLGGVGAPALIAAVAEARPEAVGVARTPDLRVSATQTMGWFATHVEMLPVAGGVAQPERLRLSGVFVRERGDWRLIQAHLSRVARPDSAAARSDSATAPSNPDSGAARAGGE
jgi:hypothetical protein